jgi:hypothetical protein
MHKFTLENGFKWKCVINDENNVKCTVLGCKRTPSMLCENKKKQKDHLVFESFSGIQK